MNDGFAITNGTTDRIELGKVIISSIAFFHFALVEQGSLGYEPPTGGESVSPICFHPIIIPILKFTTGAHQPNYTVIRSNIILNIYNMMFIFNATEHQAYRTYTQESTP